MTADMAYLLAALALGDLLDTAGALARVVAVACALVLLITLASTRLMRRWGRGKGRHDG